MTCDRLILAMILLGIYGVFGNTDCAELPIAAVDLDAAVIDYERTKTAIQRIIPLWQETVKALPLVMEDKRPATQKPQYEDLVFLTKYGRPWKQEKMLDDLTELTPKGLAKRQSRPNSENVFAAWICYVVELVFALSATPAAKTSSRIDIKEPWPVAVTSLLPVELPSPASSTISTTSASYVRLVVKLTTIA